MNREAWLDTAVDMLHPIFEQQGFTVPELRVSVGWPSSGGLGKNSGSKTIGQCWYGTMAADGKPQLFISPLLDEVVTPGGVLATLVHEVCHTVAGPDAKHGPKFRKVMEKVGLTGKPTATLAGEELIKCLNSISEVLGPFPHSKIVPVKIPKTQTTRMRKCECTACGYIARTVAKWLDAAGPPICPCNMKPMNLDSGIVTELEGE